MSNKSRRRSPRWPERLAGTLVSLGLAALLPRAAAAQQAAGDSAAFQAAASDSAGSDAAYWSNPQRLRHGQPWRTAIEFGGLYGTLVAHYYDGGRNPRNVDRSHGALRLIFSPSRLRFDDNTFNMNNIGHPIAGTIYYGIPRANGASALHSFLVLSAADLAWEQVVELREIASINDHIVTVVSGFTMGEALFQDRLFFRRARPTPVNRLLDKIFGLPMDLTELVVHRPPPARAPDTGPFGLPADVEHRFRFYVGSTTRRATHEIGSGTRLDLGMETSLLDVGRPDGGGARSGWVTHVAATEGDLGVSLQYGKVVEARWFTDVVPLGWVSQRFRSAAGRPSRGHTLLVGPSVAWDIDMRGVYGIWYQRHASALLGIGSRALLASGGTEATLALDAWGNFSTVSPYTTGRYGYPEDRLAHEATVFRNEGYYYAYGPSARAAFSLRHGALELSGSALQHRMRSIDGLDRFPAQATEVAPKWDHWTTARLRLGWQPLPGLELSTGLERGWWSGAIAEHGGSASEHGWSLRVAAAL